MFWTEEECCMKAYSWDPSSCITETKSPSGRPTTILPTSSPNEYQQSGLRLPQILFRLINAPDIDMNNIQLSKVKDAIRNIAEDEIAIFNVMITSVDIVDTLYSGRTLYNHRDLESVLTLTIEISVSETTFLPDKLYFTIIGALQLRMYEIDKVLRDTIGEEMYKGVVLEIDGQKTSLAPSIASGTQTETKQDTVAAGADEKEIENDRNTLSLVLVVLFSLCFSVVSCGLIIWQRKKETNSDIAFETRSKNYHHRKRSPSKKRRKKLKKKPNASENTLMITNGAYLDEAQDQMDEKLMIEYTPQPQEEQHMSEEELEDGYDGGKSSFFESQGHMSNNSSFNATSGLREGIDPEEDSIGEDNVLGLLYYAGASSAEEEEGEQSQSIKNARIRRRASNTSSRQTRTSARSRRSSISSSSKSKSSRSRKLNKGKSNSHSANLNKVDEEQDYGYQREEHFNQSDEPSLGEAYLRNFPAQFPDQGGSVSVSTVSEDAGQFNSSSRKSVETAITEEAASLNVDELFT